MKASSDIVDSFAEPQQQQKIDGSADNVTDVVPNPYIATLFSVLAPCWSYLEPCLVQRLKGKVIHFGGPD